MLEAALHFRDTDVKFNFSSLVVLKKKMVDCLYSLELRLACAQELHYFALNYATSQDSHLMIQRF